MDFLNFLKKKKPKLTGPKLDVLKDEFHNRLAFDLKKKIPIRKETLKALDELLNYYEDIAEKAEVEGKYIITQWNYDRGGQA